MEQKDWNYIAALEKEISKEYGELAVVNPKSLWDESKEKEYLQQLKEFRIKESKSDEQKEKVEVDGVLVPKKLLTSENTQKICLNCNNYSFDKQDDLYLNKFKTCNKCYYLVVEGREQKWFDGDKYNGK
jgi:hypothetical protein